MLVFSAHSTGVSVITRASHDVTSIKDEPCNAPVTTFVSDTITKTNSKVQTPQFYSTVVYSAVTMGLHLLMCLARGNLMLEVSSQTVGCVSL